MIVDYHTDWFGIDLPRTETTSRLTNKLRANFAQGRISIQLISDKQIIRAMFRTMARHHITLAMLIAVILRSNAGSSMILYSLSPLPLVYCKICHRRLWE